MGRSKLAKIEAEFWPRGVSEVVGAAYVHLGVGLGQQDLALGGGHAQPGGLEVGTLADRPGLQVLQVPLERLVRQVPHHVVIGRRRIVTQQLSKADQRLHLGQAGRRYVGLKLQQLQLDLQKVAFADGARVELRLGNIDGPLKILQVLLRELQESIPPAAR